MTGDVFTPNMTAQIGKVAIRVLLIEDRIITVDQKFFCDRATEKTVTLNVSRSDQLIPEDT